MSTDLLATALQADESDSECEVPSHGIAVCGSVSSVIAEQHDGSVDIGSALSQHGECGENCGSDEGDAPAMSQQRRHSGQMGTSKRQRVTTTAVCTPPKKARKDGAAKDGKPNTPEKAKKDIGDDRPLHCLFEGGTCIPLWPQYKLPGSIHKYVKIAPKEQWLHQYTAMQRKIARKGCEPKDVATMQMPKDSNSSICKQILLEFKLVVFEAKLKHKKENPKTPFPSELALTFNGCVIFANTGLRHVMMRADDGLLKWVRQGFQKALEKQYDAEVNALQAMSQPLIACGEAKVNHYCGLSSIGVRDKVTWLPDTREWRPNVKRATVSTDTYCTKNKICLTVDADLFGDSFAKARGKALINACIVWNALDGSPRYRIKLPATEESCPDYNVAGEAEGDPSAGSDSGSESNECNDE